MTSTWYVRRPPSRSRRHQHEGRLCGWSIQIQNRSWDRWPGVPVHDDIRTFSGEEAGVSFSEFFIYYVLSRAIFDAGPVLVLTGAVIVAYCIFRFGNVILGRVWGDRDLDGERDDEKEEET